MQKHLGPSFNLLFFKAEEFYVFHFLLSLWHLYPAQPFLSGQLFVWPSDKPGWGKTKTAEREEAAHG